MRLSVFDGPRQYSRLFEDTLWWSTPEEFEDEDDGFPQARNGKTGTNEMLTKGFDDAEEEKV
jgi:hypothetical protein